MSAVPVKSGVRSCLLPILRYEEHRQALTRRLFDAFLLPLSSGLMNLMGRLGGSAGVARGLGVRS
jgi:hypothetical protein